MGRLRNNSRPLTALIHRGPLREEILAVALIAAAFILLYCYNLTGWLINDDEGSFLYQVWRITEGDQPYREFFTSRWPLFLYSSAGWMHAFGVSVLPMRVLAVLLTLFTAILIYMIARQTLSPEVALLSMVIFLLFPDVFRFGRSFQPEPFYIFVSTLGLFLVALGMRKGRLAFFSAAGIVFAIATLFKLLAVLALLGCVLLLAVTWLRDRQSRRWISFAAFSLLFPYFIVFGLVAGYFILRVPLFYENVVGVNLAQGKDLPMAAVAGKGFAAIVVWLIAFPSLLLALPAAWRGWRGDESTALPSWQLPTALAFLILSRDIFSRLFLYLLPSLSVLIAASLEPLRLIKRQSLLFAAVIATLLVPWMVTDIEMLLRKEHATMEISRYVQAELPPGAHLLSGYQGLNFYAGRPSTYFGAEISRVVVEGGTFTGADLTKEIQEKDVQMVIIDTTGEHLVRLRDYSAFEDFLEREFVLVDTLPRGDLQHLAIYQRPAPGE